MLLTSFDRTLDRTCPLTEELKLLEDAGKSSREIIVVMGNLIKRATKTAKAPAR